MLGYIIEQKVEFYAEWFWEHENFRKQLLEAKSSLPGL